MVLRPRPLGILSLVGTIIVTVSTVNVRLVPGPSRGRVEVRSNGVWGSVCDDNFDTIDGKVICRMLGFTTATTVFTSSNPGEEPATAAAAITSIPSAQTTTTRARSGSPINLMLFLQEPGRSGWMSCSAWAQRQTSLTADTPDWEPTTVTTTRTLASSVSDLGWSLGVTPDDTSITAGNNQNRLPVSVRNFWNGTSTNK